MSYQKCSASAPFRYVLSGSLLLLSAVPAAVAQESAAELESKEQAEREAQLDVLQSVTEQLKITHCFKPEVTGFACPTVQCRFTLMLEVDNNGLVTSAQVRHEVEDARENNGIDTCLIRAATGMHLSPAKVASQGLEYPLVWTRSGVVPERPDDEG